MPQLPVPLPTLVISQQRSDSFVGLAKYVKGDAPGRATLSGQTPESLIDSGDGDQVRHCLWSVPCYLYEGLPSTSKADAIGTEHAP